MIILLQSPPALKAGETVAMLLQPPLWEAQVDEAQERTVWESALHGGGLFFFEVSSNVSSREFLSG